ncbi:hypothetical protein D9758_010999 [Tetrapyrgos nigripes]|uniref:AB hydrolase-1 domain-containing protein n=1 Tax=Tetrapyrgos nigripes TaxID=182062 RepID=A0A8H5GHG4_9AGAR|nr:hypothetical protein D9758_010999 [Tetrapyrgos nigripes]
MVFTSRLFSTNKKKWLSLFALLNIQVASAQNSTDFDWASVEPSPEFSWVDCFSKFQCARFQVPLDYSDPNNTQTAAIAVIKLNATVDSSDTAYGGPLFYNPGGPGLSGVTNAFKGSAAYLQGIFGNQFDIIGFDPRGVGQSTPKISSTVFKSEEEMINWVKDEDIDLNATMDSLPHAWARAQALGQVAESRDKNGTLNFVTTDFVAIDMLAMSEALGQEKLQYYGGSYGTALGSVFATMFPDRVGRVVVDGCLDMDDYFSTDLADNIMDADKTMQAFYDGCHAAGPEACAFYASSPAEIQANVEAIYASIRAQPVPTFDGDDSFGILTYDNLRAIVLAALKNPQPVLFPIMAAAFAELSAGNATGLSQILGDGASESGDFDNMINEISIWCSDAEPSDLDASQLREYMSNINSTFSGMFSLQIMTWCTGWRVHPEGRFRGPVGANTSSPLLVIGNTADPVTPLSAAKKMSASFPGSGLLIQDSPGLLTMSDPNFARIPILDYYLSSTPEDRQRFLSQLQNALINVGFLYLSNPPVSQSLVEDLRSYIPRLFSLPQDEKDKVKMSNSPHFLGYSRLGAELTKGLVDYREQYDFGTPDECQWRPGEPDSINGFGYPDEQLIPGFRNTFETYLTQISTLANEFIRLMSEALGLPPDGLARFYDSKDKMHDLFAKSCNIPFLPRPTSQRLKLLQASPHPGLQVQKLSGEWIDAPPIPGTFIINLGRALEFVTDGLVRATSHRVISPPSGPNSTPRYSIPYFHNIRQDVWIKDEKLDVPPEILKLKEIRGNLHTTDSIKNSDYETDVSGDVYLNGRVK